MDIVLDNGEEPPATNRSSNMSMVIDLDKQISTPEVIVLDDDDNNNDAQSTLGTTAEEVILRKKVRRQGERESGRTSTAFT